MRIIKPSFEIWEQKPSLDGVYKQIERAGRVCYKSEDKITDTSAKDFVDRMIKSGHGAMLEHGTIYLKLLDTLDNMSLINRYKENKYSIIKEGTEEYNCHGDAIYCRSICITTNYRVLVENNWLDDLEYLYEPTEYHEKRITVKFICDRGVSHEFVRHRVFSFAQESTRYCNYSNDKFGNECTFIIPCWCEDLVSGNSYNTELCEDYDLTHTEGLSKNSIRWIYYVCQTEDAYNMLLAKGWIAQQARAVLPNSLKTELVMTGTIEQWKGFFKLRDAGSAHPQARELAHPLHREFIKRGYLVDLYDEANPD